MKRIATLLLALAPVTAHAQGFVDFGIGAAWRELEPDPPFAQLELEYDTGTLARIEVGTQYDSGLQLRVGYAAAFYDELEALGSLTVTEDIQQQEVRAGAFYATPGRAAVGWRLGGGYAYVDEEDSGDGYHQRGGFVEGAALLAMGRRASLDLAAAFVKLGGPEDRDAEVAELRVEAAFPARVLAFTMGARHAWIDREGPPPADERVLELRLGVRFPWTYPEGASYDAD